jgi:hypothetical protein
MSDIRGARLGSQEIVKNSASLFGDDVFRRGTRLNTG